MDLNLESMVDDAEIRELIEIIKESAFEVRKRLSGGFLESVYRNALMIEFQERGIKAETEEPIHVIYKGRIVGEFRADILVEDKIIVELKAVSEINKIHELQLVNYLTATGIDYGLLINYGDNYRFLIKQRIYKRPFSRQ